MSQSNTNLAYFPVRVPNVVNVHRKAFKQPLLSNGSVTVEFHSGAEAIVFKDMVDNGTFNTVFEQICRLRASGMPWHQVRAELEKENI
jgi:hypothetical protein